MEKISCSICPFNSCIVTKEGYTYCDCPENRDCPTEQELAKVNEFIEALDKMLED